MPPLMMSSPMHQNPFKLYVSTFKDVISCLLAQDNNVNIEWIIFNLFRILNFIKQKYSTMEKNVSFFVLFMYEITWLLIVNWHIDNCKSR